MSPTDYSLLQTIAVWPNKMTFESTLKQGRIKCKVIWEWIVVSECEISQQIDNRSIPDWGKKKELCQTVQTTIEWIATPNDWRVLSLNLKTIKRRRRRRRLTFLVGPFTFRFDDGEVMIESKRWSTRQMQSVRPGLRLLSWRSCVWFEPKLERTKERGKVG